MKRACESKGEINHARENRSPFFDRTRARPSSGISTHPQDTCGQCRKRFTLRLISIYLVTISDGKSEQERQRKREKKKEKRRTIVAARGDRRVSTFSNARRLVRSMARSGPAALFSCHGHNGVEFMGPNRTTFFYN